MTGRSIGDAFTSACQAVGAPIDRWADDKAQGALPGLTA
jgi:hypothetical protein